MLAAAVMAEKDAGGKLAEVRAELAATGSRLAKAEAALQVRQLTSLSRFITLCKSVHACGICLGSAVAAQHGAYHSTPACCQVPRLNLCSLPATSACQQTAGTLMAAACCLHTDRSVSSVQKFIAILHACRLKGMSTISWR